MATLTIVASSRIMAAPDSTTASDTQGRGATVTGSFRTGRLRRRSGRWLLGPRAGQDLRQPREQLVVPGDLGLEPPDGVPEAHPLELVDVRVGLLLEHLPLH